MNDTQSWYTIEDIDHIDSPALVVYPKRVSENIHTLKKMVNGDTSRLRPHVKTHKTQEAAAMLMDAGIRQFKCATIAEAELLAMSNAPDVLLAYQPVGPKAHRYLELIKKYPNTAFSCLVDHTANAERLSTIASDNDLKIQVYIDINVGMGRTGIPAGDKAVQLYQGIQLLDNIEVLGLHAYDGHLRDPDVSQRRQRCLLGIAPVWAMVSELERQGYPTPVVVAGGSPTFPIHAADTRVVCSPGTFIFWDKGYGDGLPEQHFVHAALVLTRVISLPTPTTLCLDLGHKAIAAENPIDRRIHLLNAPGLKPISQSEEHLVVEAHEGHGWKIGDVFYGLPYHICPTVALYERAIAIAEGQQSGVWPIKARDRQVIV
ncbi:D-serine deaminase, pyridoxal phosphate-dependent [Parapedobacter luteus]|uniref:D-serine deaminase, pyridoxal phosphate-dependent n=1 Tax=Parapedobacter luteus TaxID=623280 RepID=A0A1T5AFZ4_9SPHI|nr:D-TA family PLP-dependent enzyme [Parapedobacter luteus]SKB33830.1 D-serine deaminase, pyridoxal phosphate-dependent [Parapedobacter luteus]